MSNKNERPLWDVAAPPGGWGAPWDQAAELVTVLPGDQWTLIGGLMVQIHATRIGIQGHRATVDVDMVLHVETGVVTFNRAREALEGLGYRLEMPSRGGRVHRFSRGDEHVDVMVADHLPADQIPIVNGTKVFQVPAATSALRKTVNCRIQLGNGRSVPLSIPDALGALVLKGAALKADTRDRARHLDDGAMLSCAIESPNSDAERLIGSDRGRIRVLAAELKDLTHRAWQLVPEDRREQGRHALEVLARDPEPRQEPRRLGGGPRQVG
jgi:hypothetical protein